MDISGIGMPVVIDALVALLLLIALVIGAKRGLMRGILNIFGVGLALFGAWWCAEQATAPVSQWLEPLVEKRLTGQSPLIKLPLPDLGKDLAAGWQESGSAFLSGAVMELLEPVIHAAIYLLTFLLLLLLLWLVGKILRIVEKLPVIHSCNQFGGALLGLLCGAIVVSVLLWAGGVFGWLAGTGYGSTGLFCKILFDQFLAVKISPGQ